MSSLFVLNPGFRSSLVRVAVVGIFAVVLVGLGFLVPFWIVLAISAVVVAVVSVMRAVRRAAGIVERILTEELGRTPPNGVAD
jgi:hypothetical protein